MSAEDAAALLFAVMYDDDLFAAAQNVQRLLQAPLTASRANRRGDSVSESPPHPLFRTLGGQMGSLGEAVIAIFRKLIETNTLCDKGSGEDDHLEVFNLSLSVDSPGHRAAVHFNDFDAFWHLTYEWKSADQLAYEAQRIDAVDMRRRWDALSGPYMSSSRAVDEDSLSLIADCLRGAPLLDKHASEMYAGASA